MAGKITRSRESRYDTRQNADINVTPFVDVMLVLLIIFMVSAPLATLAIKVDLPPPQPNPEAPKDPTFVSIARGGVLSISGQPTSLRTLSGDLTRRFATPAPQDENVLIRADHDVAYADFMAVVNQLQAGGFYKVALISEDVIS